MSQIKASAGRQDPGANGSPILSYSPLTLSLPGRQVDLQLRISFPVTGDRLPVILFSHGHGRSSFLSSMRGYGPLVDYFASQGFVVIQPTHLNSTTLALDVGGPEAPLFWKSRAEDMRFILDKLPEIVSAVPGLNNRVDTDQVAAVGHSMGGHTVAMLSGMQVVDPTTGQKVDFAEPRLKARVMLGVPGNGEELAPFASEHYPVLKSTLFGAMTLPALVVHGSKDKNLMFSDREDWRADAYNLSPGPKSLFTVFGAEHIFGGISGYDSDETTDKDSDRVAFVRETILAYVRSALNSQDRSWERVKGDLKDNPSAKGSIVSK